VEGPAAGPPGELRVGARVEAVGLVAAAHLNGKRGVVTAKKPGDDDRWAVRFDDAANREADPVAVRRANLRLLADEHDGRPHGHGEWGNLARVMEGVASALEEEEREMEANIDEKQPSDVSSVSSSVSSSESCTNGSDFSIHQAQRTPARGMDDVRYSLPPHDSADHRPPPSDTDASYSEDEAQLPRWCQSWKAVEKTVAEQAKWGPGGSHELLMKNTQPPLSIDEVFSNDTTPTSKTND